MTYLTNKILPNHWHKRQIYDTPNKWGELGIQDIAQRSDNQSTVKKQYKIKIVNKIKDDDLIGRFSSKKFTLK